MEKIFGVVILYHPEETIIRNIKSYLPFVDKLLVIDNSEPPVKPDLNEPENKITLFADGVNKGISERLNDAAQYALSQGAEWLLTMDQDSWFDEQNLSDYRQYFGQYEHKIGTAMIGVEFEQPSGKHGDEWVETDNLITSGSLVNLSILKQTGGFDKNLFIDEVDSEYCYRAKVNGYKTIKFKNVYLHHSLGIVSEYRSLKSLKKTPRALHSPLRVYYMVRNYLYVSRKYQSKLPGSFPHRKKALLNRIKNNFLYGDKRIELIKYLVLAFVHYKKGKMGKFLL